jgi:hypothetical protein
VFLYANAIRLCGRPRSGRGGRLNRAGSNVDAGDLRQEYADVTLLRLELTGRRSDLGGREDRRRHLIEQRLNCVVVAAGRSVRPQHRRAAARAPLPSRQGRRR